MAFDDSIDTLVDPQKKEITFLLKNIIYANWINRERERFIPLCEKLSAMITEITKTKALKIIKIKDLKELETEVGIDSLKAYEKAYLVASEEKMTILKDKNSEYEKHLSSD